MNVSRYCATLLPVICLAPACAQSVEQARALSPGRYCAMEPLVGHSGSGADISLGNSLMAVTISRTRKGNAVSFWNVMPDSPEVLQANTENARLLGDGSLAFPFVDGWGNRGRAHVRSNGQVELVMTRKTGMNQIGRNYGTYTVSREACSAPEFRVGS